MNVDSAEMNIQKFRKSNRFGWLSLAGRPAVGKRGVSIMGGNLMIICDWFQVGR